LNGAFVMMNPALSIDILVEAGNRRVRPYSYYHITASLRLPYIFAW
jgi:hypothetical protein